jgi:hypothetical protein
MRSRSIMRYLVILLLASLLLTSCSSAAQEPTPLPATATSVPSATAVPPTETQVPTPTVSETPVPTETSTPTETSEPTETPLPTGTATATPPPPTPDIENAIVIYYIIKGTGGPVSCGDSLYAVNTGLPRTGDIANDVATALKRLFAYRYEYNGALYQSIYQSNISVNSVSFKPSTGVISVRLGGTYVRTGDDCDNSRARAQIWQTIRQFSEVKTVDILLNSNLLGDVLANDK